MDRKKVNKSMALNFHGKVTSEIWAKMVEKLEGLETFLCYFKITPYFDHFLKSSPMPSSPFIPTPTQVLSILKIIHLFSHSFSTDI
jgi:hypothetical protein